MLLNLTNPITDGLKRPTVGHVVYEENTLCTAEVGCGNGTEPFLTRGIPNLKLDALTVHLDVLDLEIDSDGGDEGGGEGIVGVTEEETGFTHAGVTDHEQLALHVVGGCLRHGILLLLFQCEKCNECSTSLRNKPIQSIERAQLLW